MQAVRDTVADLLGEDFDDTAFQTAYDQLNQTEFHPFTTDNQDYLAYFCLILGSGLFDLEPLLEDIRAQRLTSFQQFIALIEQQVTQLPSGLVDIHREIFSNVQAGDPTPFKAFRRNEYLTTVNRMGRFGDTASIETLLAKEILITQEVREWALAWQAQGALIFGLSDKPDEASIPPETLAARGYLPIHGTGTHSVGSSPYENAPQGSNRPSPHAH